MSVIPTGRSTVLLAAALATVLVVAAGTPMAVAAQEDPDPVPAEYYGEVVDEDGNPVGEGVLVEAIVEGEAVDSIETDVDGRFGSPEFGGEKLSVDASDAENGTVSFRVDGERTNTTVEWEAGASEELTLVTDSSTEDDLPEPAAYSGSVVDTEGDPVGNATVEAVVENETVDSVQTNENGAFGDGADGIDPLSVEDADGRTVQFRVDGEQTATTVEWEAGATERIELTVDLPEEGEPAPEPAAYSGSVVDTEGEPVPNATVEAVVENETADSIQTNENGAFGDGADGIDPLVVNASNADNATVGFHVDGEDTDTTVEWRADDAVSVTLEVEASQDSSGGGDGSGGGGGGQQGGDAEASFSTVGMDDGATITVREAPSTTPVEADLSGTASGSGLAMEGLELEMVFDTSDFRLEVGTPTSDPTNAPSVNAVDGTVGYFTVDAINVGNDRIDNARISMTVEESELPEGAGYDDLAVYRYHDGDWEQLETSVGADGEISGEAPGFSEFAVGVPAEDGDAVTTATPATDTEPTPTADGTTEVGGTAGADSTSEPTETDSPGFGAVAALVALGAALLARRQ